LKSSLASHQFQSILNGPNKVFVTDNLRFKFVFSKKHLLGFAINKKFGSAVERNLLKRQCRAFFRTLFQSKPFVFLVISPAKPFKKAADFGTDFLKLKEYIKNV